MSFVGAIAVIALTVSVACGSSGGRNLTKRSDIDLQTCIENFDVHKDKIIRTQDSKDMGAKYINEIDLGSREECLRLCCETENCDVFVFEEKNSGSCYLFQCGPPEDFKCKFTHHANYSSAILAVNRHLPDLESQIKLTKHEQDLTKLSFRKPDAGTDSNNAQKVQEVKTTPVTTAATEAKVVPVAPTKNNFAGISSVKCSRYQFECRSTRECIAIYNACDGIPQCTDGSDEGPEIGCPQAVTTKAATSSHQNIGYDDISVSQMNRAMSSQQYPNVPSQKLYPNQVQQQQRDQDQSDQRSDQDFLRPDSRNTFIPHAGYDPPRPPVYPQIPQQAQNWAPHQTPNQMQSQQYQYEDRNNHIFNHKENGIQVSEGQDMRYNKHKGAMQTLHRALNGGYLSSGQSQYGDINNPHDNSKIINYFDDVYRSNQQQYPEKWSKNNQEERYGNKNQYVPDVSQNSGRENWAQQAQNRDQIERHRQNVYPNNPAQEQQEQNPNWNSDKQDHSHHEHEKMAHDLKHSKDLMEKASKTKETKQIKIEKSDTHEDRPRYTKVAQYKVAEVLDLQDGIAEAPGGAILSLTLGLIITCVMALLIGCRLRLVRKRIRRGGKSYAHDADYLTKELPRKKKLTEDATELAGSTPEMS